MKDRKINIKKMLDYIEKIESCIVGLDYGNFFLMEEKIAATSFYLAQIAEHASRFTEIERGQYPTIPWKYIRATRNIIVHDYDGLDIESFWNTITEDLPALKKQLQEVLDKKSNIPT